MLLRPAATGERVHEKERAGGEPCFPRTPLEMTVLTMALVHSCARALITRPPPHIVTRQPNSTGVLQGTLQPSFLLTYWKDVYNIPHCYSQSFHPLLGRITHLWLIMSPLYPVAVTPHAEG